MLFDQKKKFIDPNTCTLNRMNPLPSMPFYYKFQFYLLCKIFVGSVRTSTLKGTCTLHFNFYNTFLDLQVLLAGTEKLRMQLDE
jgi:hypothetical protein